LVRAARHQAVHQVISHRYGIEHGAHEARLVHAGRQRGYRHAYSCRSTTYSVNRRSASVAGPAGTVSSSAAAAWAYSRARTSAPAIASELRMAAIASLARACAASS